MTRFKASQREIVGLARDLMRFGGRRTAFAILLMIVAGLLESISLAFLVPLLSLLTNPGDGGFVARMFALALPAQASTTTRLAILLGMFILVIGLHYGLFRTRWGLRSRSVGEHPKAADTAGINVFRVRYRNVILAGMIAGIGGAFLGIAQVARFEQDMTGGVGFIGLAAMIFGRWMPYGVLGAGLVFGFARSVQQRLSILATPIPSEFLLMVPYIATIIVVAGVVGRARAPAAEGKPYIKS